jgi:hypothetical protein
MSIAPILVFFAGLLVLLVTWQFCCLIREAAGPHLHAGRSPEPAEVSRHG